jgi:hypothetical protein
MRMLLPALVLASVGTVAQAADKGFYLGAGVTQVKLDDIGRDFGTESLGNFKIDDTSWKLIAGFRPLDNLAVELNYMDLGSESRNIAGVQFNADAKAYAGYVVGFLPILLVDLYAKAGLVQWEGEARGRGPLDFDFDDDGTEFGYGFGVQGRLGSLGVRLEYERFDVDNTDGVELLTLGATWTFL